MEAFKNFFISIWNAIVYFFSVLGKNLFVKSGPTVIEPQNVQQPQEQDDNRANINPQNPLIRVRRRTNRVEENNQNGEPDDDETDSSDASSSTGQKKKIGKKKMEKLQRKQEDKEVRKAWLEEQEERKKEREIKQQEMLEEENKLKEERELARQQELEEFERQRIENEKKQAAIYDQWKDLIQIDAAGSNSIDQGNEEETTKNFIQYVQKQKIVNLEELAAEFRLKTQDIIDKLKDLEKKDRITGVFDDRGKYIYISLDELKAVAKYMNQMGRVSIVELAEKSNQLISLKSVEE